MTVGTTSLTDPTIFIAYSFSNYTDPDDYIWLYTISKGKTNETRKFYINVFRIDLENNTYDVFETVTANNTFTIYGPLANYQARIIPRPNKNQFCYFGWVQGSSTGNHNYCMVLF